MSDKISWKLGLIIILFLLGWVAFASFIMIPNINKLDEYSSAMTLMIWFLVGVKLMFQSIWKSNNVNIDINNLATYPISNNAKFLYLVSQKSFSISSIIFVTFFVIITIGSIIIDPIVGIYFSILFLFFWFMVDIWISNINLLFGKIFMKYKFVFLILFYLFAIPFWLERSQIITEDHLFYISKVPLLNWPGNGVYAALTGQWLNAGINLLYIIVFSAAGYLLGIYLVRKKHFS